MEQRDNLFNKHIWNNWKSSSQKMNLDIDHALVIKINSKWILDLVSCKAQNCKSFLKQHRSKPRRLRAW